MAAEKEVARVNGMPDPLVREPALRRDVARLTQLAVAEASPSWVSRVVHPVKRHVVVALPVGGLPLG